MKKQTKVGVIGCGTMGMEHVANLVASGYCRPKDVRVFDVSADAMAQAHTRFGVSGADSADALLLDPAIEAVVVACSNRYHAETALCALECGKHVLLEKPMALNEADARKVVDAAQRSGKNLHVGFEKRNSLFPRKVKAMQAELGELISGQVTEYRGHFWPQWKGRKDDGGSMFLMETCHLIDLFRWLTGSEVAEIHAIGSLKNVVRHYEYPDTQFTSLVFRNGFVGHISLCHTRSAMPADYAYPMPFGKEHLRNESLGHQYEYSLVGKKGALHFLPLKGICHFYRHEVQPDGAVWQRLEESSEWSELSDHKTATHNVQAELDEFLHAVTTGQPSALDPTDALQTHLVCFAGEEALRRRRPVTLNREEFRQAGESAPRMEQDELSTADAIC